MPAALERKLKQEADKKGFTGKRKDKYVYGALRATGWKPNREMISQDRLIRLAGIDKALDSIVRFDYGDDGDQKKRSLLGAGALVGTGVAGTLGHQAIMRSGGYGSNWRAARYGEDVLGKATGNVGANIGNVGSSVGRMAGKVAGTAQKGLGSVAGKLRNVFSPAMLAKLHLWESGDKPIQFDDTILSPWQGSMTKSKIAQEQFPAGPNPDFAPWAKNLSREEMLKLPFPRLMQYLNKRNILQQVFSKKMERLIELNSRLDEIQFETDQPAAQPFKRRIGQRFFLGNPITTAIHSPKGYKWGGLKQTGARTGWEAFKGDVAGTGIGAGVGAGIGALTHLRGGAVGGIGRTLGEAAKGGAILGGVLGGGVGTIAGSYKGTFGKKGTAAYKRYTTLPQTSMSSKHQFLIELNEGLNGILGFESELKEKSKEKLEEAKEKFRSKFQKKGHKSHGGGT